MICKNCKTKIPDDVKFCSKCGAKVEVVKENTLIKKCPSCGTEYPASAKFCKKDGTPLKEEPTLEEVLPTLKKRVPVKSRKKILWIGIPVIIACVGVYLYFSGFIGKIHKNISLKFAVPGVEKIFCISSLEGTQSPSLWSILPDGTQKTTILDKLSDGFILDISPDGKSIVVAGGEIKPEGHISPFACEYRWISFINVEGVEENRISLPMSMELEKLRLSPDANSILFIGKKFDTKTKSSQIYWYVLDVKTGKHTLVKNEIFSAEPYWNDVEWWPDSKRLLVLQTWDYKMISKFSLINQNGKEELYWELHGALIGSFKVSPDSTKIIFNEQYSEEGLVGSALFVEKLEGNKIDFGYSKPVIDCLHLWMNGELCDWSFQWHPDSEKIVISDGKTLNVVNADGTDHKIIHKGDIGRIIGWVTETSPKKKPAMSSKQVKPSSPTPAKAPSTPEKPSLSAPAKAPSTPEKPSLSAPAKAPSTPEKPSLSVPAKAPSTPAKPSSPTPAEIPPKLEETLPKTTTPTVTIAPSKLRNDISRTLRNAGLRGITVEVTDDLQVTLKGSVGNSVEKSRAIEIAKNFKEVNRVRDLIFIVEH